MIEIFISIIYFHFFRKMRKGFGAIADELSHVSEELKAGIEFTKNSTLLFLVPVIVNLVPIPPITYLIYPVPFIILLYLPAILCSKNIIRNMQDNDDEAGRKIIELMKKINAVGYFGALYILVDLFAAYWIYVTDIYDLHIKVLN